MKTIGYKQLTRLVNDSTGIMAFFAENPRDGYMVTFMRDVPIKSGRETIGKRSEYHTVVFREPRQDNPPVLRLHDSGGTGRAIRLLFLSEIAEAKRQSRTPGMHAKPADWGCSGEGSRPATFTVAAGGTCDHALHGDVHVLSFGSSGSDFSCYLYLADFTISRMERFGSGGYRGERWNAPESSDVKTLEVAYRFDALADKVSEEAR